MVLGRKWRGAARPCSRDDLRGASAPTQRGGGVARVDDASRTPAPESFDKWRRAVRAPPTGPAGCGAIDIRAAECRAWSVACARSPDWAEMECSTWRHVVHHAAA